MGKVQENNIELQEACKLFGLNYQDFVNVDNKKGPSQKQQIRPIQKGVVAPQGNRPNKPAPSNNVNYKELYESQLEINKSLITTLGSLSISVNTNFSELQKGLGDLDERFAKIEGTPAHQGKSRRGSIQVIEKSFQGNEGVIKANKTFNLSVKSEKQAVKSYLGQRMMEEFQKGVQNGFYEEAAMTLDSNGSLTDRQIETILKQDKILITL